MHGMPLNTSKLSVQSKTTVPTPTHSTKKEMYRISLSTKTTVEKTNNFGRSTDTSPLNCTPCTPKWQKPHNGESRDTPMSLNSIKKSLTRQDFEELVGFAKRFDTEKDNLLSNLNNLVQELSEKHNPLLEEGTEKLNTLEVEFDNKKCQQKEELDKLNYKIDSLKETQNSLSTMLEEKRERRLQVEQEKQGVEFSVIF